MCRIPKCSPDHICGGVWGYGYRSHLGGVRVVKGGGYGNYLPILIFYIFYNNDHDFFYRYLVEFFQSLFLLQ